MASNEGVTSEAATSGTAKFDGRIGFDSPQYLRCLVASSGDRKPRFLDIYTGWLTFDLTVDTTTPRGSSLKSYVPLDCASNGAIQIQKYPGGVDKITVIASISSFTGPPALAAVNKATASLVSDSVLELEVSVGVCAGRLLMKGGEGPYRAQLLRVAYQISVLARSNPASPDSDCPGPVKTIPTF